MFNNLCVKLLNDNAKLPTYGTADAAGLDLYSAENCVISARSQRIVDTGIAISIVTLLPELFGVYGRVAPRSGLAAKNAIDVHAGVIDFDYRGPVKVILMNNGDTDFEINIGHRIAQLIPTLYLKNMEVVHVDELPTTDRGAGGFGSTGK